MKQIYLGLAIHNHQPLGNFPWVFEEAYRKAYLPMAEALERHPAIRLSMHYSGCLIDWLEQAHPEFLHRLAGLVSRHQVEIMGGAYYEPILPAIPDADKLGQIARMSEFVNQQFGLKPTGLWLAERVWEPYLVKILAEAGVEWTLVDDTAFRSVGLDDSDLFGYYNTEEQGRFVKVFPISKYLRYSIPWHEIDEVIGYLHNVASETESRIVVLGDDGEKFGIWPKTYDHCWEKGWIDRFFNEVERNSDWLHVIPLGDYARTFPPLGRIYLPCASYDEMMEWSLPADKSWEYVKLKKRLEAEGRSDIIRYMNSGLWRNFLVKYQEINRMHKKMLRVHQKVYQASARSKDDCGLAELWKAQCNCPYWHGVFGGIYLADIRAATYSHLVQAEDKADKVLHQKRSWLECQKSDFDGDGAEEVLVEGNCFSVYVSPKEGGSIFEWDSRSHYYNLLSTVARRPEAYHHALTGTVSEVQLGNGIIPSIHDTIKVKDKTVAGSLTYDKSPRSSLIDHFFTSDTQLKAFADGSYQEIGDFANCPYDVSVQAKAKEIRLLLQRNGSLQVQNKQCPLEIQKVITLVVDRKEIQVDYQIKNTSDRPVEAVFGSEWNINLLGGGHNEQAYYNVPGITLDDHHLDSWGELAEVECVTLGNRHLGIELELVADRKIGLWRFPVESFSNSEGGIEKIYQASCVVALLPFKLQLRGIATLKLVWRVESLASG